MNKISFALLFAVVLLSCKHRSTHPVVIIKTSEGKIVAEIYTDKAPKTAGAFLTNVKNRVYNNGNFYRVVREENMVGSQSGIVQGGIFRTNPKLEESLPTIPHESPATTGLSHTNGTLSMARTEPGTAKSEFFICLGDQTQYDNSRRTQPDGQGYAAFGRVIEGIDVVIRIFKSPSDGDSFTKPVKIESIEVE